MNIFPPSMPVGGGAFKTPDGKNTNVNRGLLAQWFNAKNIAKEDFMREMQVLDYQNAFNAQEAQKQRDFEERMSNTAYSRAVQDMKNAGINPVLAYSQGGASTPAGSSATSGGSGGGQSGAGNNATSEFMSMLGTIGSIIAGIYTAGAGNATKLASAKINAGARTASSVSATYNSKGVLTGYTKKNFINKEIKQDGKQSLYL